MELMVGFIKSAHPGTEVLNVDDFNDVVCSYVCTPERLRVAVNIMYECMIPEFAHRHTDHILMQP